MGEAESWQRAQGLAHGENALWATMSASQGDNAAGCNDAPQVLMPCRVTSQGDDAPQGDSAPWGNNAPYGDCVSQGDDAPQGGNSLQGADVLHSSSDVPQGDDALQGADVPYSNDVPWGDTVAPGQTLQLWLLHGFQTHTYTMGATPNVTPGVGAKGT